jgi:hypothetical protein
VKAVVRGETGHSTAADPIRPRELLLVLEGLEALELLLGERLVFGELVGTVQVVTLLEIRVRGLEDTLSSSCFTQARNSGGWGVCGISGTVSQDPERGSKRHL